jgi:hypothetical protein
MGFKVNILDRNNRIEHVYVYGADEKDETVFSESERKQHADDKSEIHFEDQQIHLDDSIRVIKNKILTKFLCLLFPPYCLLFEIIVRFWRQHHILILLSCGFLSFNNNSFF